VASKTRRNVGHCYSEWGSDDVSGRYGWPFVYNGSPARPPERRRSGAVAAAKAFGLDAPGAVADHVGARSMTPENPRGWPAAADCQTDRRTDGPAARCHLWIAMLITHTPSWLNTRRRSANCQVAKSNRHNDGGDDAPSTMRLWHVRISVIWAKTRRTEASRQKLNLESTVLGTNAKERTCTCR